MEKWFIKNPRKNDIDYEKLNINRYIYKILLNRDIDTFEKMDRFLNISLENLHTPLLLPDLIKASNFIINSIMSKKKIRIVGDYDVDGVMSTYILYKGLTMLDAKVDYKIPHRVNDGYGINKKIVKEAKDDGVYLIITCDNGIAALDVIDYANEIGVNVIVTDHHEVVTNENNEEILPKAKAVVNPKREISKYPFRDICGAVVCYKLISYIFKINAIEDEVSYKELLPFAAMATICDIMPLVDENRIIVYFGLKYLMDSKNIGLKALIEECGLKDKEIGVYHIGFIIGPTINSSGRLESAEIALDLLFEDDENKAREYAKILRDLNAKRQILTEEGFEKIDSIIREYNLTKKMPVLIIRQLELNESVVGIIAGRIKEKYNHPTIILTKSNEELKGSGRSIECYDMFEKISKFKSLLTKFGGHKMACGLSLKEENFKDFVVSINNDSNLTKEDLVKKVYIDVAAKISDVGLDLVNDIKDLEPFGNKNPKPLFASLNLKIKSLNVFGKNRNVLKFILQDGDTFREAILFERIEDFIKNLSKSVSEEDIKKLINKEETNIYIDIVYTPQINEFRDEKKLEFSVKNYRVSGE